MGRSLTRDVSFLPDWLRLAGLRMTGLGVTGLRVTGLGVTGLRVTGLGATGLRVTGLRVTGLRVTGLGMTGLGMTGLGMIVFARLGLRHGSAEDWRYRSVSGLRTEGRLARAERRCRVVVPAARQRDVGLVAARRVVGFGFRIDGQFWRRVTAVRLFPVWRQNEVEPAWLAGRIGRPRAGGSGLSRP